MPADPRLAPRLLALPPTVRATLAGVPGPGWLTTDLHIAGMVTTPHASSGDSADLIPFFEKEGRWAWFPANPAAAVAAVLWCEPWAAYVQIGEWMRGIAGIEHATEPGLDIEAALSIIENHVRSQT